MAASLHGGLNLSDDGLGGYRPMAEINVTPFVDVMLVLLIIFMVAAPLMMVGVPLDLPKTDAARIGQTKEPIVVSVDLNGQLFIGEEQVAEEDLVARLSEMKTSDPDVNVYVRGDKGIEYGQVMKVLGQVGQAGFPKVSLIAEAENGGLPAAPAPAPAAGGP
jgi:biopolymer transport protein TolR